MDLILYLVEIPPILHHGSFPRVIRDPGEHPHTHTLSNYVIDSGFVFRGQMPRGGILHVGWMVGA